MALRGSGKIIRFLQSTLLIAFVLFQVGEALVAFGEYTQNNNTGSFFLTFKNNDQGLVNDLQLDTNGDIMRQDITVDTVSDFLKIADTKSSGFFTTIEIHPSSFQDWDKIYVDANASLSDSIKVTVYDCPADIGVNMISGYSNIPLPDDGIIDISGIDNNTHPCIQLYVSLNVGVVRPTIDSIKVTWDPLPVYLISESAQASVLAGDQINYSINYSISYVDDVQTVVWAELPSVSNSCSPTALTCITNFNPAYGQVPPNPTYVSGSASNGGVYTASGGAINGINIPANSVYWKLGTTTAGSSGTLTYQVQTLNSWQNGMTFLSQAHIDSLKADQKDSDVDPFTIAKYTTTIISSTPDPKLTKDASNVVKLNGNNYVLPLYDSSITYTVTLTNQFATPGRETIFNPTIKDDLSDIINKLITYCGASGPIEDLAWRNRVTINGGGVWLSDTVLSDISTIVWSPLSDILPGGSQSVTYIVDYSGCPDNPGRFYNNKADSYADNFTTAKATFPVLIGLDDAPVGDYAKGDKVNASISILPSVDDNPNAMQTYGDVFSYELSLKNPSISALGNVILADEIPAGTSFISANLPGSTIYYNTATTGSNTVLPDFNSTTGVFGPSWTTVAPVGVKWVAFQKQCLDSGIFPAPIDNPNGCYQAPKGVIAEITVSIDTPSPGNLCFETDLVNRGNFMIFEAASNPSPTNQDLSPLAVPLIYTDDEQTHIRPSLANLSVGSSVTGPSVLQVNQNGTYTFTIKNNGNDTANNVNLTVNKPVINVNGVPSTLTYVPPAIGGFAIDIGNAIVFNALGNIAPNQTITVQVVFVAPPGVKNLDTFNLSAVVTASDDNYCATINANMSMTGVVSSRAKIIVSKTVKEAVIPSGGDIHYAINYNNIGTAPTTGTYIIDRIPDKTVFKNAYTSGTIAGNTFSCTGCEVYFSNDTINLPSSITPSSPLNAALVSTYFTIGDDSLVPGDWVSPFGSSTVWVAWKIDDKNILPVNLNPASSSGKVGLTVTNDDDGTGAGTIGSPTGTILFNAPGVFSDQLLQAIDNQVFTTVLPDPGLDIDKVSSKDVLYAGEGFDWHIIYYNNSGNTDNAVSLFDELPPPTDISYLPGDIKVYHTWNSDAIANGATAGEVDITANPNVVIDLIAGTININIIGLPGAGNPTLLRNLEGGDIRITIKTQPTLNTYDTILNKVTGNYSNPQGAYTIYDSDNVSIANSDLAITKGADNINPIAGEEVNYTLNVSNIGLHEGTNVVITDTLPAGVCFQYVNSVFPPTWSIGWPDVQTVNCATSPTTITWNSAFGQIQYIGPPAPALAPGVVPGNSGNILISYATYVEFAVPPGSILTNTACVSNDLIEDDYTNNCSQKDITTPYPDPFVNKSAQLTVNPGSNASFTINYGNNTKQVANDVYIIDTLPDYDSDGTPDMKLVSPPLGTNGEVFYYHDCMGGVGSCIPAPPNPTFDPLDPLNVTNGWTNTPSPNVAFIAIVIGNISGPSSRNINMSLQANDPDTNIDLIAGLTLTNKVSIYSSTTDQDTLNNDASADTHTPGMDLFIDKKGSSEGGFPGVAPGDTITYTITFGNSGTIDACGVSFTDSFSVGIDELPPIYLFTPVNNTLQLKDVLGNSVSPHDGLGNNILSPVSINYTHVGTGNFKWVLGSSSTPDLNICIPPGASQTFTVYAKASTSITTDGTTITNTATIESVSPEDITSNNTDTSSTTVYFADLMVQKTGFSCGPGDVCGDGNDNPNQVDKGELIQYKIEYDNIGSIDAKNAYIEDVIPTGTCYEVGSITPPAGSVLTFYDFTGSVYPPTLGPEDCNVAKFRITFNSPLPAPANYDGENLSSEFTGILNQTVVGLFNTYDAIQLETKPLSGTTFTSSNGSYDRMATSDLDGDSRVDVIMPSTAGGTNIKVFHNVSTPSTLKYDLVQTLNTPGNSTSTTPQLIDFNGDSKLDILAGIYIFENNTPVSGPISFSSTPLTFSPHTNYAFQEPASIDLDNDGDMDVVFPEYYSGGANVYRNQYNEPGIPGTPGAPIAFEIPGIVLNPNTNAEYARDIVFANLDGQLEISSGVPSPYPEIIFSGSSGAVVFRNTSSAPGNLSFDSATPFSTGGNEYLSETVIHDFNGDGMGDILVPNIGGDSTVWQNISTGPGNVNFSLEATLLGPVARAPSIEDFDGDLKDDILITDANFAGSGTKIWRNTSNISTVSFDTASPITVSPPSFSTGKVLVANIDGDVGPGNMDIVMQPYTGIGKSIVLRNTSISGLISFDVPYQLQETTIFSPRQPDGGLPIIFDYVDQDGVKDLILSGTQPAGAYKNLSTPGVISFAAPFILPGVPTSSDPIFEDLNSDPNTLKDLILLRILGDSRAFRNTSTNTEISFESPEYYLTGTYQTYINSSGSGINWDKLQVIQDVPAGTDIKYSISDATCTTVLAGGTGISLPNNYLDISTISAATYPILCLNISFATSDPEVTPSLDAWRATYQSLIKPSFTFQVRVSNASLPFTISNTAVIDTTTSEIDHTPNNNESTYVMNVIQADLEILKSVDFVVAQPGDTLNYTLTYTNLSSITSEGVYITDTIPALLGIPTITNPYVTSTGQNIICTYTAPDIYCDDDGVSGNGSGLKLVGGETGTITFSTVVSGSAVNGDKIKNSSHIDSLLTYDIDPINNDADIITDIGILSNVYVDKRGPSFGNINKSYKYYLDYGNNGNTDALNVVIVDTIDNINLNSIVAVQAFGAPPTFTCTTVLPIITCTTPGILKPGDRGRIKIDITVNNDINLVINNTQIKNKAEISTTSTESTTLDNKDTFNFRIRPVGTAIISGTVFNDPNQNVIQDPFDTGLAGVSMYLSGVDTYGFVYGPDKTTNPALYETLMAELVNQGLLSGGPYLASDINYPVAKYFIMDPTLPTAISGYYSFTGLTAGTYNVTEIQPAGFASTGSNRGTVAGTPVGFGSKQTGNALDVNHIVTIPVLDGQSGIDYDFGESNGVIGNLVYEDKDTSGTFNAGDVGIAGVEVKLYFDTNGNGVIDGTELTIPAPKTAFTNGLGEYYFTNMNVSNKHYIVVVTDSAGILTTYNNVLGAVGVDNNGQNPLGYPVTLTNLNQSNLTADFGYHIPTGGSGCIPDASNNFCCVSNCGGNTPIGKIGDQVWLDENGDGIFNNGEIGIPSVNVTLYEDGKMSGTPNGDIDPGESISVISTNVNGLYEFDNVTLGKQYIVSVTDETGQTINFTPSTNNTIPRANNYGKDPDGYIVNPTSANPTDYTADFGYIGDTLPDTGQDIDIRGIVSIMSVLLLATALFKRYRII
jgi:uncharacterized repeat protein (TIGR01451 family)